MDVRVAKLQKEEASGQSPTDDQKSSTGNQSMDLGNGNKVGAEKKLRSALQTFPKMHTAICELKEDQNENQNAETGSDTDFDFKFSDAEEEAYALDTEAYQHGKTKPQKKNWKCDREGKIFSRQRLQSYHSERCGPD